MMQGQVFLKGGAGTFPTFTHPPKKYGRKCLPNGCNELQNRALFELWLLDFVF